MKSYDTAVEALQDLKLRGYKSDMHLHEDHITCNGHDSKLFADDFHVEEYYRFEGASDPNDSSVVYAIETRDGMKGALVDAYGTYAQSLSDAMIRKLRLGHMAIDRKI